MKNNIKVIIVKDYEEMSKKAFEIFKDSFENGAKNIGMATGSTPLGLYKEMVKDYESNKVYEDLNYFNLDEYHGLDRNHEQSYYSFMKDNLFNAVNAKNCYIPNGEIDISESIVEYQKVLDENVIDIQLLGIGNNGHIGFNEPGTPFDIKTNFIKLKNTTREANKRFFNNNIDEVPEYAITMGIADIMNSKKIVLLANGEGKASIIYKMLYGEVTELVPASILQNHPDVTVIIDRKAASMLPLNIVGVDISSTRIKVATYDNKYNRLEYDVINHENTNVIEKTMEAAAKQIDKLDYGYKLGVSISGYINDGLVTSKRLKLDKFDLKSLFEEKFDIDVTIINRADASAYGEYKLAHNNANTLYYLSLGTGIGGGYIAYGNIVIGKHGLAGEVGNITVGSQKSESDYYIDGSIELKYKKFKADNDIDTFTNHFARVITNIIHTVDPDVIVLDIKNLEIDKAIVEVIQDKVSKLLKGSKIGKVSLVPSVVENESMIGAAIYVNEQ